MVLLRGRRFSLSYSNYRYSVCVCVCVVVYRCVPITYSPWNSFNVGLYLRTIPDLSSVNRLRTLQPPLIAMGDMEAGNEIQRLT